MAESSQAVDFIAQYLGRNGFAVERNAVLAGGSLKADAYGLKQGRTMGILPYGDYFFIHDFDRLTNTMETLTSLHENARKFVNAQYRTPKMLRLSVPNIATIAVATQGFSESMQAEVQKRTRSVVGGEIHAMYLIDLKEKVVYSQGISITYIVGEARLVFGTQKEFKTIDPQNRTYYTVQNLAKPLFEQLTKS